MFNKFPLNSLAIGGYKSFGDIQRFPVFSKINLFIGQNNSGKSNILRFIHDVLPNMKGSKGFKFSALDKHFPNQHPIRYGHCIHQNDIDTYLGQLITQGTNTHNISRLKKTLIRKSELDKTQQTWWLYDESNSLSLYNWEEAYSILTDRELSAIWTDLTKQGSGNRGIHWTPETIKAVTYREPSIGKVVLIPAIRKIGGKGSLSDDFSGEGIIERLAKLQNPDALNRKDRELFEKINKFLKSVTENKTAEIEIPHERDTILVHMNDRVLPLESLGTGIHEVIILAAASTTLNDCVICMEEPELHLNPILQRKLISYLKEQTTNQYFITTHSATLMDSKETEIYHVELINNQTIIDRVTSDKQKSLICENLGYHPSDLLQANCIIWVEGPSDRLYLNSWIHHINESLIEGIHYSIMFYGGRLASHISGEDIDDLIDDFISLRRLNRRTTILVDSDKSKKYARINQTKQRLVDEFNKGPGFAWVTQGREIENYISIPLIKNALQVISSTSKPTSNWGQYENILSIKTKSGEFKQAPKTKVALHVVSQKKFDLRILDLSSMLDKLVEFIIDSNPRIQALDN